MGMTVSVYRWGLGECTNGGISARVGSLCVTNVEGPFNPGPVLPAVELVQGPGGKGHAILKDPRQRPGMVGPMTTSSSQAQASKAPQTKNACR